MLGHSIYCNCRACQTKLKGLHSGSFAYWNDGFRKLQKHERSEQHVAARNALHSLGGMRRIDEALDSSVKSNREAANKMLVNVVRALMFQTCQN